MLLVQINPDDLPKQEEEKEKEKDDKVEDKDEDDDDKKKKKKKKDEPEIVLREYSLRKRLFTMAKPKASSQSALAKK